MKDIIVINADNDHNKHHSNSNNNNNHNHNHNRNRNGKGNGSEVMAHGSVEIIDDLEKSPTLSKSSSPLIVAIKDNNRQKPSFVASSCVNIFILM